MKNFYDILATDVNSTSLEIQKAYENLLQSFDPELNRNGKQFKHRFKEIHQAYEVLNDPNKRQKYDQQLKQDKFNSGIKTNQNQQYYTKAIDITFTIVLIFFTFVFGDYVFKSIKHAKITKLKKAAVKASLHLSKSQHKKTAFKFRNLHYKLKSNFAILKPDTSKHQAIVKDKIVSIIPTINVGKIASPDKINITPKISTIDNHFSKSGFLYETFLKANETGIINLRETDQYNAAVIQVIQTGSNVFVLEKGNNYYKVKFENSIGYVPSWTIGKK